MRRVFFFLWLLHCLLAANAAALGRPSSEVTEGDILLEFMHRKFGNRDPSSSSSNFNAMLISDSIRSRFYPQLGLKENDKISKLPGQPQGVDFDQYGGYVTVDQEAGRALFYYFVEAVHRPNSSSSPLILWFNGGPGCSSLGYGAMTALGPFRVMSDGKTLYRNPYAWNEVANVLFLESPAGVGFSYSNTTMDIERPGDRKTAEDAYVFLVNWLERFPEYKGRDLYLAGESYAGHYVPQLAQTILRFNHPSNSSTMLINLKGIMIGNPLLNDDTDVLGTYDYLWTHAFISDESIDPIHRNCNSSFVSPTAECVDAVGEARRYQIFYDVYNIYASKCFSSGITPTPKMPSIENFDPCDHKYVDAYLNDVEVQKALHANVTGLNYRWIRSSEILGEWLDSPTTVLPLFKEFIANNIRILVYSGDMDSVISFASTRYALNQLKLPVNTMWQPWAVNDEVGGFSVVYDGNLTFATVRGAGHMVPSNQPQRALVLIKHFLEGKTLPLPELQLG